MTLDLESTGVWFSASEQGEDVPLRVMVEACRELMSSTREMRSAYKGTSARYIRDRAEENDERRSSGWTNESASASAIIVTALLEMSDSCRTDTLPASRFER